MFQETGLGCQPHDTTEGEGNRNSNRKIGKKIGKRERGERGGERERERKREGERERERESRGERVRKEGRLTATASSSTGRQREDRPCLYTETQYTTITWKAS